MYEYNDPSRESDPLALPDLEVFYVDASEFLNAEEGSWQEEYYAEDGGGNADDLVGWYYWSCFPGCMPDSSPLGPYPSHRAALQAARDVD